MFSCIRAISPILKCKARKFFTKENGEVNIVVIIILIAIAVGLALLFKDKIVELVNKLFGNIDNVVDNNDFTDAH